MTSGVRAALLPDPGGVPHLGERDVLPPIGDQVLIRVRAAPITPLDRLCATGRSYFGVPATPYVPGAFALRLQRAGKPVRHALVTAQLDMLDMSMQQQAYTLTEVSPGVYERSRPAFVMVGHWLLGYTIEIPGHKAIQLQVVDKAGG